MALVEQHLERSWRPGRAGHWASPQSRRTRSRPGRSAGPGPGWLVDVAADHLPRQAGQIGQAHAASAGHLQHPAAHRPPPGQGHSGGAGAPLLGEALSRGFGELLIFTGCFGGIDIPSYAGCVLLFPVRLIPAPTFQGAGQKSVYGQLYRTAWVAGRRSGGRKSRCPPAAASTGSCPTRRIWSVTKAG